MSNVELPSARKVSMNWSEFSGGPPWSPSGLQHLHFEGGLQEPGLFSLDNSWFGGGLNKQQPPVPMRRWSRTLHSGGRTTDLSLKKGGCVWIEGKTFSLQEQSGSGAGCLVRLCRLHPWTLSGTKWIKPWAAFSDLMADPHSCRELFRLEILWGP